MATSQSDNPDKRPVSKNMGGRADTSQDEINLGDYFRIVWRRKYFIVLGAVCPAFLVWLILFFSPSVCRVTYTYNLGRDVKTYQALLGWFQDNNSPNVPTDRVEKSILSKKERAILFDKFFNVERIEKLATKLTEKERRIPFDRFYSAKNFEKLTTKLRENGFEEYARDISPAKIQLDVSDTSLAVTIISGQDQDVRKISSIVTDNIEKVVPMYSVEEDLNGEVIRLRAAMADAEKNKFKLENELERKKAILARLKALAPMEPGMAPGGLVLHFDSVRESSEYLPLPYQIQATEVNIINIEQTIRADQETYDYYSAMLSFNEWLLGEVRNKMSSYYTIGEFHSFLIQTTGGYEGSVLKSYLSAYIKKIENAMSANTPAVETPGISVIPNGGLKKAGIVFVGLLMMTTFGAFLLDVAQKGQKPVAVKSS